MKIKITAIAAVFLMLVNGMLFAQQKSIDLTKPVPLDPTVRYGKLDNGLTYYIKNNAIPEKRAQFWLVVNAGAIQEEDNQNGLAHFCEHMAFNGTKSFAKKEIINYLQSIGMKFGPEINAYTTAEMTNYMLQNVPVEQKANIDTSLMILYDWAANVSYESDEIDAERGVITEEWRTRHTASTRLRLEADKTIYQGSKFAQRDVIGDLDIIKNFDYETLRSFYKDWYRPDLEAIVVVGDVNVDEVERKIKDMFSQIQMPAHPREKMEFEIPDHKEMLVNVLSDKEARNTQVSIYYKHDIDKNRNAGYTRDEILQQLYSSMINERLSEITVKADAPMIQAYSFYTGLKSTKDAYISMGIAKNNMALATLKNLVTENLRVKQFGFTPLELETAKKEFLSGMEKQYNERNKVKSAQYCQQLQQNFVNNEPVPGIEYEYDFAKNVLPGIQLEELNALAKKWITDDNRVVIISGPENDQNHLPSIEDVKTAIKEATDQKITAYVAQVIDKPLFNEKVTPSKVIATKTDKQLGTTEWTLENGIKVVLKPTTFKDDEILMYAYSWGGSSLVDDKSSVSADFASSIVSNSGISDFDKTQLEKLLSDKYVNVSPWIGELQEGFSGQSNVKDFETMLQLTYLYFERPRIDEESFKSYMERVKTSLANKSNDPNNAFRDSVQVNIYNYNFRHRATNTDLLKEVDLTKVAAIYHQRFSDPGSFTFFFVGNIDPAKAQPMIEKYLGGLPKIDKKENWVDTKAYYPAKQVKRDYSFKMAIPKGTVFIGFHNDYEYNMTNNLLLEAVNDILEQRYTLKVREEEGGTYGVGVYTQTYKFPKQQFLMNIRFDCNPDKLDKLVSIIYSEIEDLKKNGPTATELLNVKENKTKEYNENLKENREWLNSLVSNYSRNENNLKDDTYLKLIDGLTPEMIKNAAAKYLDINKSLELIMRPAK